MFVCCKFLQPIYSNVYLINEISEDGFSYITNDGVIFTYKYEELPSINRDVVLAVMLGKFSEIPKWYIDAHIENSFLRRVHTKCERLKAYWESLVGEPLGDQEVWPKIDFDYVQA